MPSGAVLEALNLEGRMQSVTKAPFSAGSPVAQMRLAGGGGGTVHCSPPPPAQLSGGIVALSHCAWSSCQEGLDSPPDAPSPVCFNYSGKEKTGSLGPGLSLAVHLVWLAGQYA